jgi:hypothetical protein
MTAPSLGPMSATLGTWDFVCPPALMLFAAFRVGS